MKAILYNTIQHLKKRKTELTFEVYDSSGSFAAPLLGSTSLFFKLRSKLLGVLL